MRYVQPEVTELLWRILFAIIALGALALVHFGIIHSKVLTARQKLVWLRRWYFLVLLVVSGWIAWRLSGAVGGIVQDWRDWLG